MELEVQTKCLRRAEVEQPQWFYQPQRLVWTRIVPMEALTCWTVVQAIEGWRCFSRCIRKLALSYSAVVLAKMMLVVLYIA